MPLNIDYRVMTDQYERRVAYLPQGRRYVPGLTWADCLNVMHILHGLPTQFYTRDFLTTLVWTTPETGTEITAAFCSQGRRRGEVLIAIPATADLTIIQRIRAVIEARQAEIRAGAIQSGIPEIYYEERARDDEYDLEF